MKLSLLPAILLTTTASIAQAGGFEAQTLDTGFMYEEGAVLTASTASLNSNLTEANGAKILKDQNFTSFSIKSKVGPLDVGLTTYRSGAIQMSGAASPTLSPNPIPNADANIETLTALLKYDLSESFSVLAGINSDKLGTSVISTPAGAMTFQAAQARATLPASPIRDPLSHCESNCGCKASLTCRPQQTILLQPAPRHFHRLSQHLSNVRKP